MSTRLKSANGGICGAPSDRIVIVGNGGDCHVGSHFVEASKILGWECRLVDIEKFHTSKWKMRICWRFLGRRDPRATSLQIELVRTCDGFRPDWVLVTGRMPVYASTIRALQLRGAKVVNFMTDDPWNPLYQSRWLMEGLKKYDAIFTPRHSNIEDLKRLRVGHVAYLPFGYSASKHETTRSRSCDDSQSDVLFVGGADKDRVVYARAFREAGFSVTLFGGHWDRYPDLRSGWMGIGNLDAIRTACSKSKVTLVLPRHANRDGHVMRSYESAASRGCILAEDTGDHRGMYSDEVYKPSLFTSLSDMVRNAKFWIGDSQARQSWRDIVYDRVVAKGGNTYCDRMKSIAETVVTLGMRSAATEDRR